MRTTRQDIEVQLHALVRIIDPDGYVLKLSSQQAEIVSAKADNITQVIPDSDVPTDSRLYYADKENGRYVVACSPAKRTDSGALYPGAISHPLGQSTRTAAEMHAALYVAWNSHSFKRDLAEGWDVK